MAKVKKRDRERDEVEQKVCKKFALMSFNNSKQVQSIDEIKECINC